MGLFDKLKKVLFDEDEVEVTVENDELPTKPSKKPDKNQGFKNYHQDEEDIIKEVVVPKEEEPVVEEPVKPAIPEPTPEPPRRSIFPVDDFDTVPQEDFGYRSQRYTEPQRPAPVMERPRVVEEEKPKEEPNRNRYRIEPVKPKVHETKDYHKYLQEDTSNKLSKKPFKVTPVISPVYGILDENYIPSEVVNKADFNPSGREGKKKKKDDKKTTLKQDLVELNSTINEMINETEEAKVVEEEKIVTEVTVEEPTIEVPVVEEEKEEVIETPIEEVVPEVEEESEPDIEDAFEPTEEIHTIEDQEEESEEESDEEPETAEPTISLDELIKNNSSNNDEDESEEDENLNNTLETDLYNLINSMYKDDDDEEEQ